MAEKTDDKGQAGQEFPGFDPKSVEAYVVKDPQALAMNFARALENLGKAASEWLGPRERGEIGDSVDPMTDLVKTLSKVTEYWISDPKRTLEAQTLLFSSYIGIWTRTLNQFSGQYSGQPVASETDTLPKDKRFADQDWAKNPFFALLRQLYLVTASWADKLVNEAEGLDEHTRHKAAFYVKQVTAALSPANFALTNPEVYRETVASNGANLVAGMKMFAEDIAAGRGDLRLRHTDATKFAIGRNMALTPGKVIAQSEVCEVIQYDPSTETVLKRPLLICPPWINKFYILDLNPQKSFIKWCVDQGHTVFVISWVNPDERHAKKDWESYMREGIDFALTTVEKATGEKQVNAIGYCVGGTLLAATLAYHAQKKNGRIASATFLTTQVDFTHAGDLKVFVDEEQIASMEKQMNTVGYLDGSKMATAFNMLRASELIWPYVVSNYLKGQEPMPFDLLYWNSDSTRMAAANHAYYLRNCYLDNNLSKGQMKLAGKTISLKDIKIPVYNLATREDHIAPPKSVFLGSSLFGGPVDFVLTGSGHIAGVVNPPDKQKYQYWTGGKAEGQYEDWLTNAEENKGSWWPHWHAWVEAKDDSRVPARKPGGKALNAIADAPGTYVLERI
ncbi:alpha/beta hydrolase [Neorhizobium galegae]|uniref:PHA/PHB synthase family protein n=1 Tax=Neorhizobium galegae TaxID=399 RepID=UPI000620E71B|nr:class I poly(R)-hydroxyalkanoic acid synthase [Neorhizobium galegae]CDZ28004.1 Poly(R)-hydroxyalkanoic acid synthase, class I [Neorhizobium galegae bv. officinalis]KAA9386983.1 class I poly(R)-hydroxyalkanoic acid synthase [Neorhizobium galegae]KAB1116096.1 class I poly(R)-hydroxyalkanoic acid synthase [Neorhizobium galegae]MCM2499968.1 class I poly(R)-hydroxyalkanoic acid synthase [Neorhizobium galegae]MCQ1773795.1 class I poly(R)-hydroxyalkanoic acid synthase [Neorhizobium galegae]